MLLRRKRLSCISEVIFDETDMRETYRDMLAAAPQYGRAIGLSPGPDGRPSPEDVSRVRQEGHVIVRIRLDRPSSTPHPAGQQSPQ